MIEIFKNISLAIFSWMVLSLLLTWLLASVYPLLRRWLMLYPAAVRASLTLLFSLTPGVIAFAVIYLSTTEVGMQFIADHCHDTLCGPHDLYMPLSTGYGLTTIILAIGVLLLFVLLVLSQLMVSRRFLLTLEKISDESFGTNYRVIETNAPLAWCAGFLQPQIYLSRGLIDQLDSQQLETVLAHEYSHVIHYDNLRKLLLFWCTRCWPKSLAKRIRNDFISSTECVCDLSAALRSNSSKQDVTTTLELLKKYCADAKGQQYTTDDYPKRLDQLHKELSLRKQLPRQSWIWKVKITCQLTSLGVVLVISTAYLGHPILEWLSR